MALAASAVKRGKMGNATYVTGILTASGSYSASGDAFDPAALVGITNRKPDFVIITGVGGFIYQYDKANKKVWVYCNTAGGANAALGEHSAATYASGVSSDIITFLALWMTVPQLPAE